MKATIIANGNFSSSEITSPLEGMLIAADGGGRHCLESGLNPQVVIGDFDSLTQYELAELESRGAKFIGHSADKDETDLELALNYAQDQGAIEIRLYGLLGGRWDMTISNLLLLASPRYAGIKFWVIDGNTEIFILRGGETLELRGQTGDLVSVIPLGGHLRGLSYEGLKWPLVKADLPFGTPRGVSNALALGQAKIFLETGLALVVVERLVR